MTSKRPSAVGGNCVSGESASVAGDGSGELASGFGDETSELGSGAGVGRHEADTTHVI